ncbi:MAG: trehalose-phosphatase [Bryobacterales bacterium]|nr:trehalose-phosphatase [Bryobacterales bacterium]
MTDLLDDWKAVSARLRSARQLLLMLDFDGTLAPIVPHPGDARVPAVTLATLVALRDRPKVAMAVVSGRGARDVRGLLGLHGIDYFGSHGRERIRPWSETVEADHRGRDAIREVCRRLSDGLSDATGFEVEDKGVSAAAHYRNARPGDRARIERTVLQAVAAVPSLRVSRGKMVYDITPADGVDKGTAAAALLRETGGLPLYFGDDTTDESAFAALGDEAVTVFVGPSEIPSLARYRVPGPTEVGEVLARILDAVSPR